MAVTSPGTRPNVFLAGVVSLVIVGVAAVGSTMWVRATFGVWGIWTEPERIPLCDMSYTKRDGRVLSYAEAVGPGPDPTPVVLEPTVGALPLRFANPARYEPGAGYNGCGHMLLLRVADDGYIRYFKLGGP